MREIKFRSWDCYNLKMLENNEPLISNRIIPLCLSVGVMHYKDSPPSQREYILMQYTGLKDKNGKDIYEGDIVEDVSKGLIGEVSFYEGSFVRGDALCVNSLINDNAPKFLQVLGNIYENPELLAERENK